jgi:hypothetical protein
MKIGQAQRKISMATNSFCLANLLSRECFLAKFFRKQRQMKKFQNLTTSYLFLKNEKLSQCLHYLKFTCLHFKQISMCMCFFKISMFMKSYSLLIWFLFFAMIPKDIRPGVQILVRTSWGLISIFRKKVVILKNCVICWIIHLFSGYLVHQENMKYTVLYNTNQTNRLSSLMHNKIIITRKKKWEPTFHTQPDTWCHLPSSGSLFAMDATY